MFGSCPWKLDVEKPPLRFGFRPKKQHILLDGKKLTEFSEFIFLYVLAEIFGFNFNLWSKIEWLPGHLDKVYI